MQFSVSSKKIDETATNMYYKKNAFTKENRLWECVPDSIFKYLKALRARSVFALLPLKSPKMGLHKLP